MKTFFRKGMSRIIIATFALGFAAFAFAQGVGLNLAMPGGGIYVFIPFPNAQQVTLTLAAGTSQPDVLTSGTYDQKMTITPSLSLANPAPLVMQVFTPYPPKAVYQLAVTVNTGLTPTVATIPALAPGYYETALYNGTTQVSNRIYFYAGPSTTSSTAGLYVIFPSGQQMITGTSANLTGIVSVGYSMPVNLSYVWGASGSPLSNETSLLTALIPPMDPGMTKNVDLTMAGLTPGTTYQFALKNKITNTISSTLQFTTPTNNTTSNSLSGGTTPPINQAPPTVPAVTDTISGPNGTGIVPLCGRTPGNPGVVSGILVQGTRLDQTRMCDFQDFLTLIANILKYALILLGPVVALVAMYAGAMIIWLKKLPDMNSNQMLSLQKYKTLLIRVAVGILIILCAWLIIATIIRGLDVKPNYHLLDLSS
jgi:hypothetical protein